MQNYDIELSDFTRSIQKYIKWKKAIMRYSYQINCTRGNKILFMNGINNNASQLFTWFWAVIKHSWESDLVFFDIYLLGKHQYLSDTK